MTSLSVAELDLLVRIKIRKNSAPYFFRKVKGAKWFHELKQREYFEGRNNPRPIEDKEDGRVFVPYWCVLDYLEKTSQELSVPANQGLAMRFLEILVSTTEFAKENQFSNYRTWWKFSEIISNIPSKFISVDDLQIVDYWLDDPYDTYWVSQAIGLHWLPSLLRQNDPHSLELATELVALLYKVRFSPCSSPLILQTAQLRVESDLCQLITTKVAADLGRVIGNQVLPIFQSRIISSLDCMKNDLSTAILRPAIEDHEQNQDCTQPLDLLIDIYRDTINSFFKEDPENAVKGVSKMLDSDCMTIRRVAVHAIDMGFETCSHLLDRLLDPSFWNMHLKHEMWMLLNHRYRAFSETQRTSVLQIINSVESVQESACIKTNAYFRAEWLAAIRMYGAKEEELYRQYVELAEAEPEHPSFGVFSRADRIEPNSPVSMAQLSAMRSSELIDFLTSFEENESNFIEAPSEGLYEAFRMLIKSSPLRYSPELTLFEDIGMGFVYQVTEAYRVAWIEKSKLPWSDIWPPLLQFCKRLVSNDQFWSENNAESKGAMIPNRHWVVGSMAALIKSGVMSDEHAFSSKLTDDAEVVVKILLRRQKGETFNQNDAVFNAINSPRGRCVEALINLTLRKCRLADASDIQDHSEVWQHSQHLYDHELNTRSGASYEVATLFASHLQNFLYLSKEWTINNLDRLFSVSDQKWWRCAMEGYSHVSVFKEHIYHYLRDKGHLVKVLDHDAIHHQAKKKVIQNICFAFWKGIEPLDFENSLIRVLILRRDPNELRQVVINLLAIGKSNLEFTEKIKEFWWDVGSNLDLKSRDGQTIASHLCNLIGFIDQVDEPSLNLILDISPYAHIEHNEHQILEWLEKVSRSQPLEASQVWKAMLRESLPLYPEESLRNILGNILEMGHKGEVLARRIVEIYTKRQSSGPSKWLLEIREGKSEHLQVPS